MRISKSFLTFFLNDGICGTRPLASLGCFNKASTASLGRFKRSLSQAWGDYDDKQYGNGRQKTHRQPTVVIINQQPRERTFCQPTLSLSTKTNMANTTFDDDNKFCPSVPRKFCLPCNNVERVPIKIAREIYYKAFFAGVVSRNLRTMRRVHSCLSNMEKSFHYLW